MPTTSKTGAKIGPFRPSCGCHKNEPPLIVELRLLYYCLVVNSGDSLEESDRKEQYRKPADRYLEQSIGPIRVVQRITADDVLPCL